MAPTVDLMEVLKAQMQPILPNDTMAEAGRKALLPDFVDMLKHEAGSRTGTDMEDVHDMRVATRRMRSIMQLLSTYYKPKSLRVHSRSLRKIARSLGAVRDLDVLIDNVQTFQSTLGDADQMPLQPIIERLDGERQYARHELIRSLDKGDTRRFLNDYTAFLTTPGNGVKSLNGGDNDVHPVQVRHLLPALIYNHLGTVRAYDDVLRNNDVDAVTLHALRIEFKKLRYLVSMFTDVLGTQVKEFVGELKAIQDHLGKMNDAHVAQQRLCDMLPELDETESAALSRYIDALRADEDALRSQVGEVWRRFNSKTVQRQLATAIASL